MVLELKELGNDAGFLKMGITGGSGSGKTTTAARVAVGVKKFLNLPGRIYFQDTETGSAYISEEIEQATGQKPIGVKSRALGDAKEIIRLAVRDGAAALIIDSATHLWDEVCETFLRRLNEARAKKTLNPKSKLDFQDLGPVKKEWGGFTDLYLNSPVHIIVCGRIGWVWNYETNDEGKKELIKESVKMRAEGDFGYEASVFVEMERLQARDGDALGKKLFRRATVLKDRFRLLDGKQADFYNEDHLGKTFDFFKPHVEKLCPGKVNAIDESRQTPLGVNDEGDTEWTRERKRRAIFCEEIAGLLAATWPGRSAEEQKAKGEILNGIFKTYSWTKIESMESVKLKDGLDSMPAAIEGYRLAERSKPENIVKHFGGGGNGGDVKPGDETKKLDRPAKAAAGKGK